MELFDFPTVVAVYVDPDWRILALREGWVFPEAAQEEAFHEQLREISKDVRPNDTNKTAARRMVASVGHLMEALVDRGTLRLSVPRLIEDIESIIENNL